jgi:CRP/FNR family transcriptional regulator
MLARAFAANDFSTGFHTADPTRRERPLPGLPFGALRVIDAKEHVFRDGDPATAIYKVISGLVCLYLLLPDGRRQVVDFAFPGDVVGLGALTHHTVNAQANEVTRLSVHPMAMVRDLASRDAELSRDLYAAVSLELQAARDLLMTVSRRTAIERVAAFLLTLAQRNERRGRPSRNIVLPMTRSDIADVLGLTIETVSRTFTKLRAEGYIDLEQCILVTIKDMAKLKAAAGTP